MTRAHDAVTSEQAEKVAAREVAHTAVSSRSERAAPLHRFGEVDIFEGAICEAVPEFEDEEIEP